MKNAIKLTKVKIEIRRNKKRSLLSSCVRSTETKRKKQRNGENENETERSIYREATERQREIEGQK